MKRLHVPEGMKLASVWVVWGFLSLGALGWALKVVVYATNSGEGMAAWVQAVGSIGAIVGAIWISRLEKVTRKEEGLVESYVYMEKAFNVAAYAAEAVGGAGDYVLEGSPNVGMLNFHIALLDLAVSDMGEIRYTMFESTGAANAFLAIKRAVALTKATIEARIQIGDGFNLEQVAMWRQNADAHLTMMSERITAYVQRHPSLMDSPEVPE